MSNRFFQKLAPYWKQQPLVVWLSVWAYLIFLGLVVATLMIEPLYLGTCPPIEYGSPSFAGEACDRRNNLADTWNFTVIYSGGVLLALGIEFSSLLHGLIWVWRDKLKAFIPFLVNTIILVLLIRSWELWLFPVLLIPFDSSR